MRESLTTYYHFGVESAVSSLTSYSDGNILYLYHLYLLAHEMLLVQVANYNFYLILINLT